MHPPLIATSKIKKRATPSIVVRLECLQWTLGIFGTFVLLSTLGQFVHLERVHTTIGNDVLSSMLLPTSSSTTPVTPSSYPFDKVWPALQDMLCPELTPNISFGTLFFDLAYEQILLGATTQNNSISNNNVTTNHSGLILEPRRQQRPKIVDKFFKGEFWGMATYQAPNSTSTLAYLTIWKAGNNFVRSYMKHSLYEKFGGKFNIETELYDWHQWVPELDPTVHANPSSTPSLCILTAIRDPISHFLSGYNELEYRNLNWYYDWTVRHMEDNDNHYGTFPKASVERFEQFVVDLLNGCKDMGKFHLDVFHAYPMMRVLTELAELRKRPKILRDKSYTMPNVKAYMKSITNLSQTWPSFMQESCPDSLPKDFHIMEEKVHLENTTLGSHESSNDTHGFYQAAKTSWKNQGSIAKALCILHTMDYACWRDLPRGIPKLCEEVYSSKHFVDSIVNLAK